MHVKESAIQEEYDCGISVWNLRFKTSHDVFIM